MRLKLTAALCAAITLSVGVPAWGAGPPGDEGAVSADMVGEMASLAVGAGSWSKAFAPFTLGNGQEFPDQTDQQALAVAARQDPSLFAANSTRILDPPAGATVEKYLDDFSARIDIPGQGPDVIATSTTPVRVKKNGVERAVDLKLVDVGDAIEPKTPVVALSFADTLGGGITIAENIRMRIVGADPRAAATIAGQQVFYANALKDADVFAMPLPAGLETFVQLRSSDSPKTITYQFDLPKGARLVALPGEHAGIAIVRDDDLLAMIDAPVSKDANDAVVPTTTSIHGTRLSLHVAADESTAYPILVDPVVTDNQFLNGDSASSYGQFQNTLGWRRETSGALGNFTFAPNADNPGSGGSCYRIVNNAWVALDRQLCVSTQNTRTYAGEIGQWSWRPPGGSRTHLNDGAGITFDGYVYRAFVRHSYTRFTGSRGAYMFAGIKSGRTGQWIGMNRNIQQSGVADDVRYGPWTFGENTTTSISNPSFLRDYCANTACSPESTDPNIDGASFAFGTYALGYGHALSANAQGAVFYQYDRTPPSVTHATNSDLSGWKNSGTVDTVVSSSDKGMGIKRVGIIGGSNVSITSACTGGILSNCPQNPPPPTLTTNVADIPEGLQQITGYADDILDKRTLAVPPLTLKVDRSPPAVTLSGALYEQRGRTITDDEYALRVDASDGSSSSSSAARSGVMNVEIKVDGAQVDLAEQPCPAGSCPLTRNWTMRTREFASGEHLIEVVATDHLDQRAPVERITITVAREPVNVSPPLITGAARDGDTLRTTEGTFTGATPLTYTYQWQACDVDGAACRNLSGETESQLLLRWEDIGRRMRVIVTATNASGTASETSTPTPQVLALAPTTAQPPLIRGVPAAASKLWAVNGIWDGSPATYSYQWQRCAISDNEQCTPIPDASGATYVVGLEDLLSTIRVRVTATNAAGDASALSDPPIPDDLQAQAPPEPEASDPSESVQDAEIFRTEYGLDADPDRIAQLDADPTLQESREVFGISLTRDEQRDIEARDRWQAQVHLVSQYGAQHPDAYAGVYLDQKAGGRIRVAFTSNADAHLSAVRALFPYPDKLTPFDASQTLTQLRELQQSVEAAVNTLAEQGINVLSTELDVAANAILVGVPSVTAPLVAQLLEMFGPGVSATAVGATTKLVGEQNEADRIGRKLPQDAVGGLVIESDDDKHCSLGFVGTAQQLGSTTRSPAFVTAGHCSPGVNRECDAINAPGPLPGGVIVCDVTREQKWLQGEKRLGEADGISLNSYEEGYPGSTKKWRSDAIPIRLRRSGKPRVYFRVYRDALIDRQSHADPNTQPGDLAKGTRVCASLGAGTLAVRCGAIVSQHFIDRGDTRPQRRLVHDAFTTTFKCKGGDSGSPVYLYRGRNRATALGIIVAAVPTPQGAERPSNRCVFTHLKHVFDETFFRADVG